MSLINDTPFILEQRTQASNHNFTGLYYYERENYKLAIHYFDRTISCLKGYEEHIRAYCGDEDFKSSLNTFRQNKNNAELKKEKLILRS